MKRIGLLDIGSKLFAYEAGEMPEELVVEMFQELVDSGLVLQLQGSYQRAAAELVRAGLVTVPANLFCRRA
jgi:hypothetical protein